MGNNELSTCITKGFRVNDSIVNVENRKSGLGQAAQASLDVIYIGTPPVHNLNSINGSSSREFHLQPGSGVIGVREGSGVVINGIFCRKFIFESGRLSGSSRCSFVVLPRKGSEFKDLDVLASGGFQTNFFSSAGLNKMKRKWSSFHLGDFQKEIQMIDKNQLTQVLKSRIGLASPQVSPKLDEATTPFDASNRSTVAPLNLQRQRSASFASEHQRLRTETEVIVKS
jgi:hypothetical protein